MPTALATLLAAPAGPGYGTGRPAIVVSAVSPGDLCSDGGIRLGVDEMTTVDVERSTLNETGALLSALVVRPSILVWAQERNWVSRRLVPPDVLDRGRDDSGTPRVTRTSSDV
jgi:hypothetical protein